MNAVMKMAFRRWQVGLAAAVLLAPWIAASTATAAVTTAAPQTPPTCPYPDGPYPTFFPDTTDAQRYYVCSNGQAIALSCADGLLWSQIDLSCVIAGSVPFDEPISDQFTDTAGGGASGLAPARITRAAAKPAAANGLGLGGEITYTIAITSPLPDTAANIQIDFPTALTWVGGQDCFNVQPGHADCMVYAGPNTIPASTFTLQADLLDLGPQTVTAHVAHTYPAPAQPIPDRSLTCTALTGAVVIC